MYNGDYIEKDISMKRTFRPDLTDYIPYIEALTDKLNEDGLEKMSRTDAVKIAIERSAEKLLPSLVINKIRKKYIRLDF